MSSINNNLTPTERRIPQPDANQQTSEEVESVVAKIISLRLERLTLSQRSNESTGFTPSASPILHTVLPDDPSLDPTPEQDSDSESDWSVHGDYDLPEVPDNSPTDYIPSQVNLREDSRPPSPETFQPFEGFSLEIFPPPKVPSPIELPPSNNKEKPNKRLVRHLDFRAEQAQSSLSSPASILDQLKTLKEKRP